jgi:hypothetical protein
MRNRPRLWLLTCCCAALTACTAGPPKGPNLTVTTPNEMAIPVRQRVRLCGCGCEEQVTGQRQYVNQDHYTVWLTRVQYPRWKRERPVHHKQ